MSSKIVEHIQNPLTPIEREALAKHLESARDDGERYQQAFQWLGLRRNADYRDRVIQLSTLAACNRDGVTDDELLSKAGELELDSERWTLPPGQAALGRILAGLPPTIRGPVLTTNFDPLTEIAVRKAGGNPSFFVNADDSSFLANLRVQSNPFVLHLHGFWRDSTTLSTPEQLELRRPVLEASLRYVLEHYTLVVIGYGGWSDVIARIIRDQVDHQRVESLDVLWAFYETKKQVEELVSSHPVIGALAAAPGSVQFYASVDANQFLPELEKSIAEVLHYPDVSRDRQGRASLAGWTTVTPGFLDQYKHLATPASAITFLDGRLPSWQDAISPHVSEREPARVLYNQLKQAIPSRESSIDLILGASGEGKSTIAMQFAALASLDEDFGAEVLYLEGDHLGTDSAVLQLPSSKSFVLVVDDAYRFTNRLQELVTKINGENRTRIHIVLVSRDTDWHNTGATTFAWRNYLRVREHRIRGISRADALSMVSTWEELGEEALGELKTYPTSEARLDALLESSVGLGLHDRHRSLLGALLSTRFGDGLRDHIAQLMLRLKSRLIWGSQSGQSLLDAMVMISIPYAYEILDLEPVVLADALGLDWPQLVTGVLEPLGDEAAITYTSGRVIIRHELIASAVIDVSLEWNLDLGAAVHRLVAAAARRLSREGYAPRTGSIAYIASRITDLPELAVSAATAARVSVPSRLSYVTHLSAAQRRNRKPEEAQATNQLGVDLMGFAENVDQARAYLTEWGVVEGNLDNWARNAVLVGIALQDSSSLGRLTPEKSRRAVSCLLLALRRLEELEHDQVLVQGIAAVSVVSRGLGEPESRAWLREAERLVDRNDVRYPDPTDAGTISKYIQRALYTAKARIESPLPSGIPAMNWGFDDLMRCVSGTNFMRSI